MWVGALAVGLLAGGLLMLLLPTDQDTMPLLALLDDSESRPAGRIAAGLVALVLAGAVGMRWLAEIVRAERDRDR